jgi:hypothetical protein
MLITAALSVTFLPLVAVMVWRCWHLASPSPMWSRAFAAMTLAMVLQSWRENFWHRKFESTELQSQSLQRPRMPIPQYVTNPGPIRSQPGTFDLTPLPRDAADRFAWSGVESQSHSPTEQFAVLSLDACWGTDWHTEEHRQSSGERRLAGHPPFPEPFLGLMLRSSSGNDLGRTQMEYAIRGNPKFPYSIRGNTNAMCTSHDGPQTPKTLVNPSETVTRVQENLAS